MAEIQFICPFIATYNTNGQLQDRRCDRNSTIKRRDNIVTVGLCGGPIDMKDANGYRQSFSDICPRAIRRIGLYSGDTPGPINCLSYTEIEFRGANGLIVNIDSGKVTVTKP